MERIWETLEACGVRSLDPDASVSLESFVREVVLWSGRIHLVGKRRIRETLEAQVLDSLLMLEAVEGAAGTPERIADIGSGAGFPGIIWKIARRNMSVTLYERKEKASRFLERVISKAMLDGISVVQAEADLAAGEKPYGAAASKAAGRLDAILPVAEKLLGRSGIYVTIKGGGWRAEASRAAAPEMRLLRAAPHPHGGGEIILYRKAGPDEPAPARASR
jgi:16S rRNA (guanine527-N7)-methyltransferase